MGQKLVSDMTESELLAYRTYVRERGRVYRNAHREELRERAKERRQANLSATREYDAAWKRQARANQTEYADDTRTRKRSPAYRSKTNDARAKPANREAQRKIRQRYSANPQNRTKEIARTAVNKAIHAGHLTRPESCDLCSRVPGRGRDGRSLIRADHYMGYAPEHHLTIQWVCTTCDGALERERAIRREKTAEHATIPVPC